MVLLGLDSQWLSGDLLGLVVSLLDQRVLVYPATAILICHFWRENLVNQSNWLQVLVHRNFLLRWRKLGYSWFLLSDSLSWGRIARFLANSLDVEHWIVSWRWFLRWYLRILFDRHVLIRRNFCICDGCRCLVIWCFYAFLWLVTIVLHDRLLWR